MEITTLRIDGAAANDNDRLDVHNGYTGESVLALTIDPSSFDFVVSKYGFGEGLKKDYRLYRCQTRNRSFQGQIHLDDHDWRGRRGVVRGKAGFGSRLVKNRRDG